MSSPDSREAKYFGAKPGEFFDETYGFNFELWNSTVYNFTMEACKIPRPTRPPMLSGAMDGWVDDSGDSGGDWEEVDGAHAQLRPHVLVTLFLALSLSQYLLAWA